MFNKSDRITHVDSAAFEMLDAMSAREITTYMRASEGNNMQIMLYLKSLACGDHYYEPNRQFSTGN